MRETGEHNPMVSQQDLDTAALKGDRAPRFQSWDEGDKRLPPNEYERPASSLDVLGELSARMKALEAEHRDMKTQLNEARERGETGLDVAHVNHVMLKHFPHDRPDERSESEQASG